MPEHAIARIKEEDVREAILLMDAKFTERIARTEAANEKTAAMLSELTTTVKMQQQGNLQWQQSGADLWRKFELRVAEHENKDDRRFEDRDRRSEAREEEFWKVIGERDKRADDRERRVNAWIIGTLLTLLLSVISALGVVTWDIIRHPAVTTTIEENRK